MNNSTYSIHHTTTERPANKHFELHNHDNYEIFLFIEGDTNYIVEENSYILKPYDIIVIRKNEMHRAFHNSETKYQRFVINVLPEFFEKYNCCQYEENFFDTSLGNKISADVVMSKGIYDAFMRLKRYTNDLSDIDSPIAPAIITEILHLINNTDNYIDADIKNKSVGKIINHLNENFTDNISLDELERKFYISKHYICRSFKKVTGLTLHQYVTKKKMAYIRELIKNGKSISEAASLAGYNSYASFYRAYIKEHNSPPKATLTKQ